MKTDYLHINGLSIHHSTQRMLRSGTGVKGITVAAFTLTSGLKGNVSEVESFNTHDIPEAGASLANWLSSKSPGTFIIGCSADSFQVFILLLILLWHEAAISFKKIQINLHFTVLRGALR